MAEKGEVFDSTLLKNMINSLIAEGKRNFAIDLSPLDYIYSDAINVILALNRRILDVSGRLSIMGPSPEVRQILERTGLHNILKIFDTETELLKSSEDIILQTTRYNVADLQTFQQAPPKPKSEFEDFRSEISTAMSTGVAPAETEPERGYRQAPPQYAAPQEPPAQQYAKPAAFKEEEFEAAYKSFETEATQDSYGPPPQAMRPQAPPQYGEPFTPPPVPPPRLPAQPYKRPEQEFAPVQGPMPTARRRDADYGPPRTEPVQSPPPTRSMRGEDVPVQAEAAAPKAKHKQPIEEKPGRDYGDFSPEAEEMAPRKRSAIPVIITLLVVALLGIGGYYGYTYIKGQQNEAAPAVQPPAPAVSQPAPAPAPAVAAPAPAPAVEPAKEPAAAVVEPVEKTSKKTPPAKQTSKKTAAESARKTAKAAPEEGPAMAPPSSSSGKLTITSSPSNATIKADENVLGTTPFVWKNPNIIGEVTIVVSKAGFKESAKTIEFTGGSKTEYFKLEKEEAAPVAKPAPRPSEQAPEPEAAAPAPAPKPAPPPPAPAAEAPAPAPAAASAGGEPATIFISSLPPVADVYMDGKLIGKTNITKLNVLSGSHSMRFVKGTQETTQDKTFKPGDNPSWFVSVK